MATTTDPARELADLCSQLFDAPNNARGDQFLAGKFGVSPWSAEFFQIIFTISKRIDDLILIIGQLESDEDIRNDAVGHLNAIRNAFSQNGLNNNWTHSKENFISPTHVQPIKMLSPLVRTIQQYPKLEKEELGELLATVDDLQHWLGEHQLAEQDFIRQALLDGVEQFRFRLERLGWLGWGYTLQSLRDVVSAYMALERGSPDLNAAPDAAAMLKKTRTMITSVLRRRN